MTEVKYRLLNWLACPECKQYPLTLDVFSKSEVGGTNSTRDSCDFWCGYQGKKVELESELRYECVSFDLSRSTWSVWKENTDFIVNTGDRGARCQRLIDVPRSGKYEIRATGIPASGLELELDGRSVGVVRRKTANLANDIFFGTIEITEGRHRLALVNKGSEGVTYVTNVKLKPLLNYASEVSFDCSSCNRIEIKTGILRCGCGRWFAVKKGIPFILPDSLRDLEGEKIFLESHKKLLTDAVSTDFLQPNRPLEFSHRSNRYKKAEINIAKSSLPSMFFEAQYQLPFDSSFPARSFDFISRFITAAPQLSCRTGDLILDVGVGSAWTSEWLTRMGFEVLAMDICVDYLLAGIKRMGEKFIQTRPIHLVVGDAENMPFRESITYGVFSYDAFHHIYNRRRTILDFDRVLKAGGMAVFVEPTTGHQAHPRSVWVSKRYGILEREVTLDELKSYCKGTNFHNLDLKKFDCHSYDVLVAKKRGLREFTSKNPDQLCANLIVEGAPKSVPRGKTFHLKVLARNKGNTWWLAKVGSKRGTVSLGAQLYDTKYNLLDERFGRSKVPKDVYPGQEAEFDLKLRAPNNPGKYLVELDMVDEGIMWFKDYDFNPLRVKIKVK